jgi:hypothetical protein
MAPNKKKTPNKKKGGGGGGGSGDVAAVPSTAMVTEARRGRAEEFRDKLSRDAGTSLTAAACEELLGSRFHAGAYTRPIVSSTEALSVA